MDKRSTNGDRWDVAGEGFYVLIHEEFLCGKVLGGGGRGGVDVEVYLENLSYSHVSL
jgi:hypothetical protein